MIKPVILSGGVGARLWPLSREHLPKQLMPLFGKEHTLFQKTLIRLAGIPDAAPPVIVCNESHRFMVAAQMQALNMTCSDILLEPAGQNTCPAITVGALAALKNGDDPDLLVLPADHLIRNDALFASAVQRGSRTHCGRQYRHLRNRSGQAGDRLRLHSPWGPYSRPAQTMAPCLVREFTEKPDYEKACSYVNSKEYFWNSGIFMFRASVFL